MEGRKAVEGAGIVLETVLISLSLITMSEAFCGSIVQSRRGLLAFGWQFVSILTIIAFITASIIVAGDSSSNANNYNNNNNNNNGGQQEQVTAVSLTSKAMEFAAMWTAIVSMGMMVWGTVLLGVQSPTGTYYSCCVGTVHKTTSMSLGAFIGALAMYSNLTLVCAVLFGEFQVS